MWLILFLFFLVEANRASIFTTNALSDLHRVEKERLQAKIISLNTQIKLKSQVSSDLQNFYLCFYGGVGGLVLSGDVEPDLGPGSELDKNWWLFLGGNPKNFNFVLRVKPSNSQQALIWPSSLCSTVKFLTIPNIRLWQYGWEDSQLIHNVAISYIFTFPSPQYIFTLSILK